MLFLIKTLINRTVVRVSVGKSQALYSWEGGRLGATALGAIGGIRIDLPQHPVALHGVMTRSSRQLSSTLQVKKIFLRDTHTNNKTDNTIFYMLYSKIFYFGGNVYLFE